MHKINSIPASPSLAVRASGTHRTRRTLTTLLLVVSAAAAQQFEALTMLRGPGAGADVCAINNQGEIALTAFVAGPTAWISTPFLVKNGNFQPLALLPGFEGALVRDLNDRGDVVGSSLKYPPPGSGSGIQLVGTIWRNGIPSPLPLPAPSQPGNEMEFRPSGVNNKGTIVGQIIEKGSGVLPRNVMYRDGKFTDVLSPVNRFGAPVDVNNSDEILFLVGLGFQQYEHYLLKQNGFEKLNLPPGAKETYSLNDHGEVLGRTAGDDWLFHSKGVNHVFPKPLGSEYMVAWGLNNKGEGCAAVVPPPSSSGGSLSYYAVKQLRKAK